MTALYVRSRRLPAALATSLGAIVVIGLLWTVITHRTEVSQSLAVMIVLLALVPLIPTLTGDDDSLEKTTARPWPVWRVVHLLAGGVFITAVLAGARIAGVGFGPTGQILRDSAGLVGLIGLSSALLGPRLAWGPPVAWGLVQVLVSGAGADWQRALFWLVQPVHDSAALTTAGLLLVVGVPAYAWRPAPPAAAE